MSRATSIRLTRAAMLVLVSAAGGCGKGAAPKGRGSPSAPPAPPAAQQAGPRAPAVYQVILKSTWTARNHPFEYPSGARFSGLIGASHNAKYTLFAIGRRPTPGLERLSEEGKHSPLDDEINAAIAAGHALALFETGSLKNFKDSVVTTVQVDAAHPMVSVVAMIQPSPDWFTGAANVNLVENGAWVGSRTLRLPAYDSGGDDGTSYKSKDRDTHPKKPTSRANNRHFVVKGKVVPVATLRLIRQ